MMATEVIGQKKHQLEDLNSKRLSLLDSQKDISDQIHHILTKEGGLNETSKLTCKNLEAAVAASKRPGYLHYYEGAPEIQHFNRSNQMQILMGKLRQLQGELVEVEANIAEITETLLELAKKNQRGGVEIQSLSQITMELPKHLQALGILHLFHQMQKYTEVLSTIRLSKAQPIL